MSGESERHVPDWISEHVQPDLHSSVIFRFKVTVAEKRDSAGEIMDSRTVDVDVLANIDLDYETLEKEMEFMPAQYAYWSTMYSQVRFMSTVQERALRRIRAQATEQLKKRAERDGIKYSVEQLKALVDGFPTLLQAEEELAKRQMHAGKLYAVAEAIKMKSELARALIGMKRQERSETR